jgi:rubredoxin
MKNRRCSNCDYNFQKSTNLEDEKLKPKIGDISVCIKCGFVSRFGEKEMIPVKSEELDKKTLLEVLRIRKAIKVMREETEFGEKRDKL